MVESQSLRAGNTRSRGHDLPPSTRHRASRPPSVFLVSQEDHERARLVGTLCLSLLVRGSGATLNRGGVATTYSQWSLYQTQFDTDSAKKSIYTSDPQR